MNPMLLLFSVIVLANSCFPAESDISVTVKAGKRSYKTGEPIDIVVTFHNNTNEQRNVDINKILDFKSTNGFAQKHKQLPDNELVRSGQRQRWPATARPGCAKPPERYPGNSQKDCINAV
ncbi:MAG TPA: hypothetical protein VKX17_19705 [Planctomycetota bacterium]|nr:hypothetical protein [Planctomycetota bacterium]